MDQIQNTRVRFVYLITKISGIIFIYTIYLRFILVLQVAVTLYDDCVIKCFELDSKNFPIHVDASG